MSRGFSNPIIGGGGDLVYPAIKSPNFQVSPLTGWSIDKDGNAYFASITLPTGATVQVYYQATAPTGSIAVGSLWFGTASGNQISRWDGSAWVAVTWDAGSVLGAGTISASLLVAGIVVAGIVDSTTISAATITGGTITGSVFDGTDFVINSDGAFFYGGTPAAGNLLATITPTFGTDPYGNAYQTGITNYTGTVTINLFGGVISISSGGAEVGEINTTAGLTLQGSNGNLISLFNSQPVNVPNANLTAGNPSSPLTPEVWHVIAPGGGFTDNAGSGAGFRVKLLAEQNVCLLTVNLKGSAANGTTIGTLPSLTYSPAYGQNMPLSSSDQATGQSPHLYIPAGSTSINVYGATTSGSVIAGTLTYPLD